MAEKLEYTFTVTENSTLLSYKFAGVLDEPDKGNVGSHFGDEHPTMSVKVTAKKNGTEIILPCNSYNANANSGNEDLRIQRCRPAGGACRTGRSGPSKACAHRPGALRPRQS